jgi:hypothetical protein
LATGALSTVAYPTLLQFIPVFRQPPSTSTIKQEPGILQRRAQSVSIISRQPQDYHDDDFDEFEKECGAMEAHRAGLLSQLEQQQPPKNRYNFDFNRPKSKPKIHRGQRSSSAPLAPTVQNVLDIMDEWGDIDDCTVTEFMTDKIQQRAQKLPQAVISDVWDDDFDGEDDFDVPVYMQRMQTRVDVDREQMRKFALHVRGNLKFNTDLMHVYQTTIALQQALSKQYPEGVKGIEKEYKAVIGQIELMLNLGDYKEGDQGLRQDQIKILDELLMNCDKENVKQMREKKEYCFGSQVVGYLLDSMVPLKLSMVEYSTQLRELLTT